MKDLNLMARHAVLTHAPTIRKFLLMAHANNAAHIRDSKGTRDVVDPMLALQRKDFSERENANLVHRTHTSRPTARLAPPTSVSGDNNCCLPGYAKIATCIISLAITEKPAFNHTARLLK